MENFDKIIKEMTEITTESVTNKGKNARSIIFEYGYHFDSKEELDVFEWILEAKNLGFINSFTYQPKSFILFDGCKNEKGKFVIRPHEYTPDFKIEFTNTWISFRNANKIKVFDKFDEKNVYIDVKGTFNKFGGDERTFSINSKWTYAKYGIFVWKIIPIKLFEKTWLPEKCVLTRKTKKISSKYKNLKTFNHHEFAQNPK